MPAIIESHHVRGQQGWGKSVRSAGQPELPVILPEAPGALVGLMGLILSIRDAPAGG